MNKIIRDHYPVSALPDELRRAAAPASHVRLIIEQIDEDAGASAAKTALPRSRLRELGIDPHGVKGVALADIGSIATPRGTTPQQAVRRVRRLREDRGN